MCYNYFDSIGENKMNNKDRINYIDTTKCLLILLVLLGHILLCFVYRGNEHYRLIKFIYSFHLPAFFLITGVLFNKKKWIENNNFINYFKSRVKLLLIPYLFLDLLGGFIYMFLFNKVSKKELLLVFKNTLLLKTNVGGNWFLISLFVSSILLYLFIKHFKKIYILFMIVLVLMLYKYKMKIVIIDYLVRSTYGLLFMVSGYSLKKIIFSNAIIKYSYIILFLLLTITISQFNDQVEISSCTIGHPVLGFISGITGALFILGISYHLQNKLFNYIGRNTLIFMSSHYILIHTFIKLFKFNNNNINIIFMFLFVLFSELPIIYIYNLSKTTTKNINGGI